MNVYVSIEKSFIIMLLGSAVGTMLVIGKHYVLSHCLSISISLLLSCKSEE